MASRELSASVTSALSSTPAEPDHTLPATPDSCYWGYLDPAQPPALSVGSGAVIDIEAVTHHSGDAPDLMMDDGVTAIWDAIDPTDRAPGVHIMTGPIDVDGAEPGGSLLVRVLDMQPRMKYGSNCAANWGLLYDTPGTS